MTQATTDVDTIAQSPAALLFPDLESELSTTRRVLERVPDGKDDWKPHPKSRSLGELATHIAQLPGFGIAQVTEDVVDGTAGPPRVNVSNNAERLKLFDQVSGEFKRQLQQLTWDRAQAPWTMTVNGRVVIREPRSQIIRSVYFMHGAHHRAQLGVYLRLLDVAVPWSYGDSADERPPMAQADGSPR